MEFTIDRDPFLKGLSRIQTVVERRNTKPILGNALLETGAESITISATDQEVSLRTACAARIEQPGAFTLNAKVLYEIVRELPLETIHFHLGSHGRVRLVCGRSRFDLMGLPAEQFPEIPQPEGTARFSMAPALLADMLTKTHFAISNDENRLTLNGVLVTWKPAGEQGNAGLLRVVATDTHRLAKVERALHAPVSEPCEAIIPKKAVFEIRKILEEPSESLEMIIGDNHIQVIKPEITLIATLRTGRFPDFRRVVPKVTSFQLDIPRQSLLGAVKRMSTISYEKSRGVRFRVTVDLMKISTDNPEQDAGEEEMTVSYSGTDPLDIGFNTHYLREILEVMTGENLRFLIQNFESPVILITPEQEDTLFVLMPMRV